MAIIWFEINTEGRNWIKIDDWLPEGNLVIFIYFYKEFGEKMSKISKAVFLINSQPNVDVLTQWLTKRHSEKGKHPDARRATRSSLGRPAQGEFEHL